MIPFNTYQEFDNHECIVSFFDKEVGLKGFFALHNTRLGPALGGTRCLSYESEEDGVRDALRLSKAMSYKCALAGLSYGGGKAVIILGRGAGDRSELMRSYAQKINLLGGNFHTGEDVGISEQDVKIMAQNSPYIIGRSGIGGSPSPWAAQGVLAAIKGALSFLYGDASIKEKKIAVKGLGKVGIELVRLLYEEGALITAADISTDRVAYAQTLFPKIEIASPEKIHQLQSDIYSPCALGNEFNEKRIAELNCRIVCGAANNQLSNEAHGLSLHQRDILYIPDYVANAGGLINVAAELHPDGYSRERVQQKVAAIKETVEKIIHLARLSKEPTHLIADHLARSVLNPTSHVPPNPLLSRAHS